MARLPTPGSDDGQWGLVLNDFLLVEHNADGTLKLRTDGTFYAKPSGGIPAADLASAVQSTLANALKPGSSAGGDLMGAFPNPTVAKLNGVAISGTPATGQVLTATGSTSAGWSVPAASINPNDALALAVAL